MNTSPQAKPNRLRASWVWKSLLLLLLPCACVSYFFVLPAVRPTIQNIQATLWPRQPLTCNQIAEEPIFSLDFDAYNQVGLVQWVKANYDVTITDYYAFGNGFHWTSRGKTYYVSFADQRLEYVSVDWDDNPPIASEALLCLGSPEQYDAMFSCGEATYCLLHLQLWYMERGFLVSGSGRYYQQEPPPVEGDIEMQLVHVARPEAVFSTFYSGGSPNIRARVNLERWERLKPWPGSLEKVVVE